MLLLLRADRAPMRLSQFSLSFIFLFCIVAAVQSQVTASITSTLNTNCNGTDCNYSGPSILINELMISPTLNDGSISGVGTGGGMSGRGEWIELYNPNICQPIDISCYYLGNNTGYDASGTGGGGYVIPAGTIIPPAGFCLIRGGNVPAVPSNLLVQNGGNVVELVVPFNIADAGVCSEGSRLWFPNTGGWFAFYDNNGVPQDAITWGAQSGLAEVPCIPLLSECTPVSGLSSYTNIPANRKTAISNVSASTHQGLSLQRASDGGNWVFNSADTPTYATCNAACIQAGSSSCTGTATVTASGGVTPYTYQWDDSQAQMTATAVDLCAGTYCVVVTDANGDQTTACVTIADVVPAVNFDIPASICIDAASIAINTGTPIAVSNQSGTYQGAGVTGAQFNPAAAGTGAHTITYTYTDEFGCSNTASDAITVNPLPTGAITGVNSPYCFSQTPVSFTLQPAGGTLSGPGTTGTNTFIPATAGVGTHALTYNFTDANSCSNSTTTNIQVIAGPSPVINTPDVVCIYDPLVPLTATPAGGTFTLDGVLAAAMDPAASGAGNHALSYVYTDANGCIGKADDQISVIPRPQLDLDLAVNYCYGTTAVALNPTPAGGTLTGDFISSPGLDLSGASPGTYTIFYTYSDANGCGNTLQENFTVSPRLFPDFDYTVNCAQIATFTNLTPVTPIATGFSWEFGGAETSSVHSPVVPFASPGTYNVTLNVTDSHNCVYDTTRNVYIEPGIAVSDISVPNIITANGDNVNDFLEFSPDFLECFTYKMHILNRWGNIVYEMSNTNNRFYGLDASGKTLEEGVYFYTIESEDFDCTDPLFKGMCSGNITISR